MTSDATPPPSPLRRFTVKEYHHLIEIGFFKPEDRLELLRGWLVLKPRHSPRHAGILSVVQRELSRLLPTEWMVRTQMPVTMRDSEPEPDLAIVPAPAEKYMRKHPRPLDVALAVEVADGSRGTDRGVKWELYASVRIPVYWIVNLIDGLVDVYSDPRGGKMPGYREHRDYGPDEDVPLILDGNRIAVVSARDLLP